MQVYVHGKKISGNYSYYYLSHSDMTRMVSWTFRLRLGSLRLFIITGY